MYMSTLSIDYSRIHLLSDPKVSVGRERTEAEAGLIMSGWRMIPLEDLGQLLSKTEIEGDSDIQN